MSVDFLRCCEDRIGHVLAFNEKTWRLCFDVAGLPKFALLREKTASKLEQVSELFLLQVEVDSAVLVHFGYQSLLYTVKRRFQGPSIWQCGEKR